VPPWHVTGQLYFYHENDVVCTRMSGSSDVEAFILTAVCEELEKKRKNKKKRIWTNDIFVSR
jgi:hypothetical protein